MRNSKVSFRERPEVKGGFGVANYGKMDTLSERLATK
jgi:hypothetical protein